MKKIEDMLIDLGFNAGSIGLDYWTRCIEIYKKKRYKYGCTLEYIYSEIAKEYKTTRNNVERAMRTASSTAKEEIIKRYNYKNKLTTKSILRILSLYINN